MAGIFNHQPQKRDWTGELFIIRTALGLYETDELASLGDYLQGCADDALELASMLIRDVARVAGDWDEGDGICRVCEAECWSYQERYCGLKHEQQHLAMVDALAATSIKSATEIIIEAIEERLGQEHYSGEEQLEHSNRLRDQLIGENRRLGGALAEAGETVSIAIHNLTQEGSEDLALHGD